MSALLGTPPFSTTSQSRFQSLYADISRQKHSNPQSFYATVQWWQGALEAIVGGGMQGEGEVEGRRNGNKLVLSAGSKLIESVRIQGVGKPLALGPAINELRNMRLLIPLQQFINSQQSIYDHGYLPTRIFSYVLGKPIWWALGHMGVVSEDRSPSNERDWWGEYVVRGLVEKAADGVEFQQRKNSGQVSGELYSLEGFTKEFEGVLSGVVLSEVDLKILIRYLERDRGVVVLDREVIKFVVKEADAEKRQITPVDRGILELKDAVRNMHTQVDVIQIKMDECTKKASSALLRKQKLVALSYLRSKKQLEDLLRKRLGSLEVLENTLIRVEGAAGDVEIMKQYERSTTTLRTILSHPSLQRDKIDETMDAMAEATADAKDVDEVVRIGGLSTGVDDVGGEDELEEELRGLVIEAEGEMAEAEKVEAEIERLDSVRAPEGQPSGKEVEVDRTSKMPLPVALPT